MKTPILLVVMLFSIAFSNAQNIVITDIKVKNNSNEAKRTLLLNLLRDQLKKDHKQEFVFVVSNFTVSSNGYAWMMGSAQRKDGKPIDFSKDTEDFVDCCHVEALFQKKGNNWSILQYGAFSTDAWYFDLWETTKAPKKLFKGVFIE